MTLNAVNGARQATYLPPFCKLFQRSKKSATTFGQHLLTLCAMKREQMLHASGMILFYSQFQLARSYDGGFETLLGKRRWTSASEALPDGQF